MLPPDSRPADPPPALRPLEVVLNDPARRVPRLPPRPRGGAPALISFSVVCAAAILLIAAAPRAVAPPVLTVSGHQFAIDGDPTFLRGVSLFDALGPVSPRDEDLNTLR